VEIAVNGDPCDPLSFVTHRDKATTNGRKLIAKLKDVLDRQQFEIVLQARIGSKVVPAILSTILPQPPCPTARRV